MSIRMRFPPNISRTYRITVEGKIDPSWSDWLSGMELISQKEADGMQVTMINGVLIDQAALRGLLNRLWDLNLVIRSVQQVDPAINSHTE